MLCEQILKELEYSAQIYDRGIVFCNGQTICSDCENEYCINVSGRVVTIVFRGTYSKNEWASNLRFCKKKVPYGNFDSPIRVHSGFIDTYKKRDIRNKIHSLIPDNCCKIVVTGHSRGAALAALCAVDLQYNFPDKNVEAYLFGCPRIGNVAFAKSYNNRVFKTLRIVNGNDIVTKIPPAIFGYRHIGTRISVGHIRTPLVFSKKAHYPSMYYKNLIYKFFT